MPLESRLRARIRQLEDALRSHGLPIPPEAVSDTLVAAVRARVRKLPGRTSALSDDISASLLASLSLDELNHLLSSDAALTLRVEAALAARPKSDADLRARASSPVVVDERRLLDAKAFVRRHSDDVVGDSRAQRRAARNAPNLPAHIAMIVAARLGGGSVWRLSWSARDGLPAVQREYSPVLALSAAGGNGSFKSSLDPADGSLECAICFEPATDPLAPLCCQTLFCAACNEAARAHAKRPGCIVCGASASLADVLVELRYDTLDAVLLPPAEGSGVVQEQLSASADGAPTSDTPFRPWDQICGVSGAWGQVSGVAAPAPAAAVVSPPSRQSSSESTTTAASLLPPEHRCAETGEVMRDPVRAGDGRLYERTVLQSVLTLPNAMKRFTTSRFEPDRKARRAIREWRRRHPNWTDNVYVHDVAGEKEFGASVQFDLV